MSQSSVYDSSSAAADSEGTPSPVPRAALAQATFSELAVPWARPLEPAATFTAAGRKVASCQDGRHIRSTSSPRPYLHPVRTLAGTVVTDHQPTDHVWHLGVGVALQDVNGINFWGGRTYTRDAGRYAWRPDHGRIVRTSSSTDSPGELSEELAWNGPDGVPVLREQRTWAWAAADHQTWRLTLDFTLTPAGGGPVSLGSPGSNGRPGGGYGGFFWRLAACDDARVWSPAGSGESAVHGSRSPWLAWSGTFNGEPATLVFTAHGDCGDPWFVRVSSYPGVGQSLAWSEPVLLHAGESLHRSVTVLISDARLETADIVALVAGMEGRS